tara:strand:- start:303 stop:857 length:555 start_codon:yes stop_codon:yes gene_type:complete
MPVKTEILKCEVCNTRFERASKEVKRNKSLSRKIYCGRKCLGLGNKDNLGEHLSRGRPENLVATNRLDKHSNFRWFMNVCRQRSKKTLHNKCNTPKEMDIDLAFLLELWDQQGGICPISGMKMKLPSTGKNTKDPDRASLDRIDNSEGYIKGNVRFISMMANFCRNDFTDEQVIDFCRKVISNN